MIWTQEDISILADNYSSHTNDEMMLLLPKFTKIQIFKKANALLLKKSREIRVRIGKINSEKR